MIKKSIDHLTDNNMTYYQHFIFASGHGLCCIYAGFLLLCHSIVPGFFAKTGSALVNRLNQNFVEHNEYIKNKRNNRV